MNAVVVAVGLMLLLSLLRVHVVLALAISAIVGGLVGGLSFNTTIQVFTAGLGGNAEIAFSYALLGGFAIALAKTGLPDFLISKLQQWMERKGESKQQTLTKMLLFLMLTVVACMSQNLIPIHIAFIPILIPPILTILNQLQVDRRLIACILTFGLTAPYMLLPYGFGQLFHRIIADNMAQSGLVIDMAMIPKAMFLPTASSVLGLVLAVFVSYRKNRAYHNEPLAGYEHAQDQQPFTKWTLTAAGAAVVVTVAVQWAYSDSMVPAALSGIFVLLATRAVQFRIADDMITDGMKMMAFIGFVMLAAAGFADVIRETGHVETLVADVVAALGGNKAIAVVAMLAVGLVITLGIGSSFSTIPIIAVLFVPLGMELGLSTMAIISLIGSAGAIGDAGAPASDSTLGPTAGLNADGQHNHIWDTCVPTFLHFTVPLFIFGWIAAMIL
ncbi:Na+/H+ antiporter family protein [Shouchella clausii]|uniref:Sodium:proton antiporter n=1 Tax=Shouchella clausii TaxID=79880 RepID=A0A268S1I0_SHOCL|nr:Na+/H+ antiporter family protein [Shouchella clausii]PAD40797.1 sodium:proton antiporter [Bacillus sp. 7520-S]AST96883.1 sodium:proton antiporter [Shouchella clausii]MBU8597566.1 Na+/H+ antiporter family protein [Shouchella clausii]MCR1287173.1 Na+/H+ antiporter family protein [Shouchella clausii]MCY1105343.1 Na+/H+ antiporter family protein [Shouchella clausii]